MTWGYWYANGPIYWPSLVCQKMDGDFFYGASALTRFSRSLGINGAADHGDRIPWGKPQGKGVTEYVSVKQEFLTYLKKLFKICFNL